MSRVEFNRLAERDPKEPYEIIIPEDIVDLWRNYDDFILQTTQGNFIISLDFLLKILKRSRGKLTGQLLRTRKHIVDLE